VSTDDEQQDSPEADASSAPAEKPEASASAPEASEETEETGETSGSPSAETTGTEVVAATATATPPVAAPAPTTREDLRNRFLMPLLLPLAAIFVAVLVALNISRLFLAGGKTQSAAVVVATVITLTILIGAAALSAARHVRTSSLVLGLSLVLVLVFSAGLISFGSGEEKKGTNGPAAPAGPPVNTLEIDALPTLSFQATSFTVPAGINQIDYVDKGTGGHTLVFSDPKLNYFNLAVPAGPTKGKVQLVAGVDYTVYCTIPGHRAAGMQATIHVTAGAPPAAGASTTTTAPAG
jgi:plastocyanin